MQETFEDARDLTPQPIAPSIHDTVRSSESEKATHLPDTEFQDNKTTSVTKSIDPGVPLEDHQDHKSLPALQKSPLLTGHRVSLSSIENNKLEEQTDTASHTSISLEPANSKTNERPTSPGKPTLKSRGLSGNLPSMPWGASASKNSTAAAASSVPAPKKLGMSFSWLSRGSSSAKDAMPANSAAQNNTILSSQRRDTVTSISSLTSNPELMLSKLGEESELDESQNANGPAKQRDSLRERFKLLRMREEAGIKTPDAEGASGGVFAGLVARSASVGLGIGSPTTLNDENEVGLAHSPPQSPESTAPPKTPLPTDTNLAPGTASGASAGIFTTSDQRELVDWDLWQAVVYEGPAAVARTSAEELNRAIAGGIPSAIRGVVWQVLAQSKNEDLEGVYRELVVRGTDKDPDHVAAVNGQLPQHYAVNGINREKLSVASSRSSVHSDQSTPATSATNGLSSPTKVPEKDSESASKLQAAMIAERKQKAKEDAAVLQKLEKVIKRDLGARTSYSKYAAAAGLQEGLFGVCKAYALFDEGVGYAQGMNFLVMPLLFNVSRAFSSAGVGLIHFRCRKKKRSVCSLE